jgi:uncharacterized protein YciI
VLYAIIGRDVPDSLSARTAARPLHLQRLQELQADGRLLLAGPLPAIDSADPGAAGYKGSLIVAEFDSLDDAQTWSSADPYVTTGVFENVEVLPFRKVLPS